MLKKLRNKNEGFTIIEVLIVLAIAGLILLIVFLAVPALQRNSRNTQRRNEVSSIMGAVNEYAANKNGKLPGVWDVTDVEFQNAAGDADGSGTEPKLSFYTAANLSWAATVPGTLPTADTDKVYLYGTGKCNGTTPTGTGASSRAFVAYYFVESSGTPAAQCLES